MTRSNKHDVNSHTTVLIVLRRRFEEGGVEERGVEEAETASWLRAASRRRSAPWTSTHSTCVDVCGGRLAEGVFVGGLCVCSCVCL